MDDLAVRGIAKQAAKPVRKPTNKKMSVSMGVSTGKHMTWDSVASSKPVCKGWLLQSIDRRVHETRVIVEKNIGSEDIPLRGGHQEHSVGEEGTPLHHEGHV